ncbi:MmcB family DNA repair protein [Frigidibacter sp. ROC022]|uniref:MmcB family DNA repair protein n=1 Tax=Frigidibacter sp. ROC022 TaxID=2971796 RepID=UPI00215B16A8|nr:MmcB family DNA repair protein [Frigidibacter sp. ROC022]MCR8725307.1 MmcB family DNA repair protein [Frigidibacter sp. ROC022]
MTEIPPSEHSSGLQPGQLLARGTCRHLIGHGFATVEELVPAPGLRVDVMALGAKGEIWVVECKSSRADFQSDQKWQNYLPFCDRFFWAVSADFPLELLPEETGLIIADGYDAEILRVGPETRLAGARRKVMTRKFARHAALRLQALRDPGVTAAGLSPAV